MSGRVRVIALTFNQRVVGSIPTALTNQIKNLSRVHATSPISSGKPVAKPRVVTPAAKGCLARVDRQGPESRMLVDGRSTVAASRLAEGWRSTALRCAARLERSAAI